MSAVPTALQADWLGACRRAAAVVQEILAAQDDPTERARETGTTGEGGDRTLVIDALAEDAIFAELELLHRDGHRFVALSEERGRVPFGGEEVRVVIDPIDGSVNAKRGLLHHAMSVAVADGPTMADVRFAFVHDFGPREEWVAVHGEGAMLNGVPIARDVPERRNEDGTYEVLGVEAYAPETMGRVAPALAEVTHRVRTLGSMAATLCHVAAGRLDGMLCLRPCRGVDAAAAQLIVREAGGVVAFVGPDDPLSSPVDLSARWPMVAARTPGGLRRLCGVPGCEPQGSAP